MTRRDEISVPQVPPRCAPLMDRLQLVLDGAMPSSALDIDAHAAGCDACRERIAAARLMLDVLATPAAPSTPPGLTDSILAAVREDRYVRIRRRSYAVAGGAAVAIAASVLLLTWLTSPHRQSIVLDHPMRIQDQAHVQLNAPVAPEPRQIRLGDEFSRVGQALLDTPKAFTSPTTGGPGVVLGRITDSISLPTGRPAGFEPTRDALAELPQAARSGLEPVTSTTQKAFARLVRDVGGVQVSTRPKS
jgi:hypothetical protein